MLSPLGVGYLGQPSDGWVWRRPEKPDSAYDSDHYLLEQGVEVPSPIDNCSTDQVSIASIWSEVITLVDASIPFRIWNGCTEDLSTPSVIDGEGVVKEGARLVNGNKRVIDQIAIWSKSIWYVKGTIA